MLTVEDFSLGIKVRVLEFDPKNKTPYSLGVLRNLYAGWIGTVHKITEKGEILVDFDEFEKYFMPGDLEIIKSC